MKLRSPVRATAVAALGLLASLLAPVFTAPDTAAADAGVQRFLRFRQEQRVSYGILEGDRVQPISGPPYAAWKRTGKQIPLRDVQLLPPTEPRQVFALAGNYLSHHDLTAVPPKFQIPQPFLKPTSCLVGSGDSIVLPKDSRDVHFEGELVIVIGKTARNVPKEKAMDYVFGVTCGNDVSERYWQNDEKDKDVQWWRAKGADTFGPVGPYIATGLNVGNLLLRLRQNGVVKQEERTTRLIHDIPSTVSFLSHYVTLHPGDLIFTGTPGTTGAIHAGDVIEVELEGVGVLRNPVTAVRP